MGQTNAVIISQKVTDVDHVCPKLTTFLTGLIEQKTLTAGITKRQFYIIIWDSISFCQSIQIWKQLNYNLQISQAFLSPPHLFF